jgi:hypothetical protein
MVKTGLRGKNNAAGRRVDRHRLAGHDGGRGAQQSGRGN